MSSFAKTGRGSAESLRSRLDAAGVSTTGQFLAACSDPLSRRQLASATGLSEAQLQGWLDVLSTGRRTEFSQSVSSDLVERGFRVVDRS